ncbi:MAG TPA: alpha/beta family hydrolase [Actinomycetota bacterium]|nr:alpha/beta family hydrolase [Actinomycetota bacterium]
MATGTSQSVTIPAGGVHLSGDLVAPGSPRGVVVFAHGSGSSRHSPRNRAVASALNDRGLATLLVDLLTEDEEQVDLRTRHLRFDVRLLAERLAAAAEWTADHPSLPGVAIGYFGASTGAAAALIAAALKPEGIGAIVSRGGRPDLAGDFLPQVSAPTLLLVGGRDDVVLDLNRQAQTRLECPAELQVIPGATHLFEEPGALEAVSSAAGDWFLRHLPSPGRG